MNTEITALGNSATVRGWVLFDGDCPQCVALARRFERLLARRHFALAALQTPWVRRRLGLADNAPLREMGLLMADGKVVGGADALVELARTVWWCWPVFVAAQWPGALRVFRAVYRWMAARRHCLSGVCRVPAGSGGGPNKTARRRRTRTFFEMP